MLRPASTSLARTTPPRGGRRRHRRARSPTPPTHEPPAGLRIASMHAAPADLSPVDPACASAVDVTLLALAAAGHHPLDDLPELPSPDELVTAFGTVWNVGAAGIPLVDPEAIEPLNRVLRDAAASGRLLGLRRGGHRHAGSVTADRRVVRRRLRPAGHADHGVPAAAGGRLAHRDGRRPDDGDDQLLPDGDLHVDLQRDRPAGDLRAGPPRRGARASRSASRSSPPPGGKTCSSRSPASSSKPSPGSTAAPR